ncbi:MAG: ThuA domain-containing protein [Thermoguttaceae bacterium]|jgi:type 1 glutamine amidotransferase
MFRFLTTSLFAVLALTNPSQAESSKPIKVLWCTGGGFHDYKGLQSVLTTAIQKYSPLPIAFTASTDPKDWAKKGFADKYDLLVLFFSVHDPAGKPVVLNLAKTIYDGKPAVVIHGTLHSYRELGRDRDDFCEAMGLTSVKHDNAKEIATKKVSDHWIVADWPDDWKTPRDELYENVKLWPNATPLLTAYSDTSKKVQVVAWINHYGKGRVFGTTLGHGSPTTEMESYHKLLANGLLWAYGREKK